MRYLISIFIFYIRIKVNCLTYFIVDSYLRCDSAYIQDAATYELYVGVCQLENEMLKAAKNAQNGIFWSKNVIFQRF